jgi:ABC-type branched-subunit amino acid transport system permease subunit
VSAAILLAIGPRAAVRPGRLHRLRDRPGLLRARRRRVRLLLGFTGLLSFGHALFWGGAGYVATILIAHGVASFPSPCSAGVAYAFVVALVGAISVRRSGIYFAMITLAIAEIQYFFAFQLIDLTGGENGYAVTTRGITLLRALARRRSTSTTTWCSRRGARVAFAVRS